MKLFFILLILAIIGKCASSSEFSLDFLLSDLKKVESIASPSAEPTAEPTPSPTEAPSAIPSANPSVEPSVMPSVAPSNDPSSAPTLSPSNFPSAVPTAPSARPTFVPTYAPTANNLVSFSSQTTLYDVSPAYYNNNRKACNETMQEAVSSVMPGTKPSDVQNIIVSDGDSRTSRALQIGSTTKVQFTVRTYLTGATYESLSSQLTQAAVAGTLTAQVKFFAAQLNAPELLNATVAAITTENELVGREGSEKLTGSMIAGLVIGIFMALGLIAAVVYFFLSHLIFPASSNGAAGANGANNAPVENNNEVADVESPRELANQI